MCVREDHTVKGREAVNTLVGLRVAGNDDCGEVLVSGNDFYSSPRISPDGSRLAWLTWNHPNMPWDGTELWQSHIETDGSLVNAECVAGRLDESIFQPEWSPDGVLSFVSDRNGWWNLHRLKAGREIEAVTNLKAELGVPQWAFGLSSYAFATAKQILCAYQVRGMSLLATIDIDALKVEPVDVAYTDISFVRATAGQAVFRAGSPTDPPAIVDLIRHWSIENVAGFKQS